MSLFRPMLGHIAVELLIVDGPAGSAAAFTAEERGFLRIQAQQGLALLARFGRRFGDRGPVRVAEVCSFDLSVHVVPLPLDPAQVPSSPLAEPHEELRAERDEVWQAALAHALGYDPPLTFSNYTEDQRRFVRGQRRFGRPIADSVTLVLTKYGCHWVGFQEAGSGAAVLWYTPLVTRHPWAIGQVMAHEIGHVFDAPDEYGHCNISTEYGFFATPNVNCVFLSQHPDVANPGPRVPCIMDLNPTAVCRATEAIWGWVDSDSDGVAELFRPCDFTLSDHRALPTQKITITGTNVWDARVVTFRPTISGPVIAVVPRVRDAGTIEVTIPEGIDPLVTVEFATRAGDATSTSSTLFVNDVLPPFSREPIVWGVRPVEGIPPGAGDQVRILGVNLFQPVEVTFGGVAADLSTLRVADANSAFGGDSDISITLPPGVSGTVEVAVTTSEGTSGPFPPFSQLVCR